MESGNNDSGKLSSFVFSLEYLKSSSFQIKNACLIFLHPNTFYHPKILKIYVGTESQEGMVTTSAVIP